MIRPILQLGSETLGKKSSPIKDLHSKDLERLIKDLSDTLHDTKKRIGYGRGIAAPQIGELKRGKMRETSPLWTTQAQGL